MSIRVSSVASPSSNGANLTCVKVPLSALRQAGGMAAKKSIPPRVLDVRSIVREGGSPCAAVNGAMEGLGAGQELVLMVPFEPRPLYAVMARSGYAYECQRLDDGTWRVRFFPLRQPSGPRGKCAPGCGHADDGRKRVPLDARRLAPPAQLAATLQALDDLGDGECLALRSARKPARILSRLGGRGYAYDCTEQADHSFLTEVWRQGGEGNLSSRSSRRPRCGPAHER